MFAVLSMLGSVCLHQFLLVLSDGSIFFPGRTNRANHLTNDVVRETV